MSPPSNATGKLADKKALVIAGTSGMGLATAQRFYEEGARVAITGTSEAKLAAAAKEIGGGSDILTLQVDVRSIEDQRAAFKKVEQEFGKLDVLFINHGVAPAQGPIAGIGEDVFDTIMDVNFKGAFFALQLAIPLMAEGSSIVFNSSIVSVVATPQMSVYAASKAAMSSLVLTASAELAPSKVRVNAVNPGPIETPMLHKATETMDGFADMLAQKVPFKRLGRPVEVANAVLFLASDEASFITGTTVTVDGGIVGSGPLA